MSEDHDNVISLASERNRREQPDPQFIRQDEYGRPLYTFGVDYEHEGRIYSFHFIAYDWEDAEAKVASMRNSAALYGQIYGEIPA